MGYLNQADLACDPGVSRHLISVWRHRYPDFPGPDEIIGRSGGWLPSRVGEIRAWMAARPGQAAAIGHRSSPSRMAASTSPSAVLRRSAQAPIGGGGGSGADARSAREAARTAPP